MEYNNIITKPEDATITLETNHIVIPIEEYKRLLRTEAEYEMIVRVINSDDMKMYQHGYEFVINSLKLSNAVKAVMAKKNDDEADEDKEDEE